MLTLHTFGPMFGLPDPSPFVVKTMAQLRMAGVPFAVVSTGLAGAPKGKLPFIEDDGVAVGDSVFITDHLHRAHGVDLDARLTPLQRAQAWAIERMLEDHLYFAMLHARWMDDGNFEKGPAQFFAGAPEAFKAQRRAAVGATLHGQGTGRHSEAEIAQLAERDLAAANTLLGAGPFLFGDVPCGADATLYGFTLSTLCPLFDTPLRAAAQRQAGLLAHADRITQRWFAPALAD